MHFISKRHFMIKLFSISLSNYFLILRIIVYHRFTSLLKCLFSSISNKNTATYTIQVYVCMDGLGLIMESKANFYVFFFWKTAIR